MVMLVVPLLASPMIVGENVVVPLASVTVSLATPVGASTAMLEFDDAIVTANPALGAGGFKVTVIGACRF